MKFLNQFFDWERFVKGKEFMSIGQRDWEDEKHTKLGTKVESAIVKDDTPYVRKDRDTSNNLFEKITFKCKKNVVIPLNAHIIPINAVVSIYNDFSNPKILKLSVTCDDIQIVQQTKA